MKRKQVCFYSVYFTLCTSSLAFAQTECFIPKALLMPFHNHQQQLYVSAGFGGGYDINVSYSLFNHFAVFATGTFNNGVRKRTGFFGDRYNIVKHDQVLTYGVGYFKQPKGKLNVLETYAGYGTFKVNNYWYFPSEPDIVSFTQANYINVFWQVNVGRKTAKREYGFMGRFSYFNYQNVLFYDVNQYAANEKNSYTNVRGLNFDPAFCYGYTIKGLSINGQVGLSVPLIAPKHTDTDPVIAGIARVSLQYTLNFTKRKTKQ